MKMLSLVAAVAVFAAPLRAQDPQIDTRGAVKQGQFIVQTVPLHHLSSNDAEKLLQPYVQTPGGGVFGVANVRAITIRETTQNFMQMRMVLDKYDRAPVSLTLNFQLVAADNSGRRDNVVAGLDSLLRGVLKFSGYHLLGTAVVNVAERSSAQQTLNAGGQDYKLFYEVQELSVDGASGSVQLRVSLQRSGLVAVNGATTRDPILLSTGVTIPLGNTVVLGTSVENARAGPVVVVDGVKQDDGGDKALILTVRPQLANTPKRD